MEERVLFVDDDPNILEAYQRKLQHALKVHTAQGPHAGLKQLLEKGPFAVVVADMNMPLMNGVEFLEKARELAPETVRMMLTGNADIRVAMDAVNSGNVFRFLTKPCPSQLMGESLIAGIKQYRLVMAEKEVLEGTLNGAVELLVEILSWVRPDAFGRTLQVRSTVKDLAARLKVPNSWEFDMAAVLSQIGYMAIPQEILGKVAGGEQLNVDEQQMLATIPAIGQELLQHIPRLNNVARIVLYQDKQYNGGGFPGDSVAGKDIPLGARVLKVAIDLLKLRASGLDKQEAINEMARREGWYDPHVLQAAVGTATTLEMPESCWRRLQMPFAEVRAGLTLASDILTADGRKLVAAGTELSEALLVRLKKFAELKGLTEPIEIKIRI
ncbi:MAG: response regulator [Candidatus Hydrogenedentes bacterium]|nr:response regulator [Candidatus Hydrogenedentota bacterium]